ncbi:hypothetical protein BD779DRAFT_1138497 [Infundibulicybe gibba]|nr:hypothetical protein BD779DRAFT_1138497 [Infundibulicybe gibba]
MPLFPNSSLSDLAGSLVLSYLFNLGLHGILCAQVYNYYIAFPLDRVAIKCLVYGIFWLEVAQTLMVSHDAFNTFGTGFGQPRAVDDIHLLWLTAPVTGGLVACTSQLFFSYRINRLSGSWIIVILIVALSLASGAGALATAIYMHTKRDFHTVVMGPEGKRIQIALSLWCAGSALCDLLIAASMTYLLSQRDTGFHYTHVLITKLMRLIIETGMATAATAVVGIALFVTHNLYFIIPTLTITKLYSNTILAIFNNRMHIVGARNNPPADSTLPKSQSVRGPTKFSFFGRRRTRSTIPIFNPAEGIRVQTETRVWCDIASNYAMTRPSTGHGSEDLPSQKNQLH